MTTPPPNYLIDGPLYREPERRAQRILDMAAVLMEAPSFVDRDDEVRLLRHRGYGVVDVAMLLDEARYEKHQQLVARVISDD